MQQFKIFLLFLQFFTSAILIYLVVIHVLIYFLIPNIHLSKIRDHQSQYFLAFFRPLMEVVHFKTLQIISMLFIRIFIFIFSLVDTYGNQDRPRNNVIDVRNLLLLCKFTYLYSRVIPGFSFVYLKPLKSSWKNP